MFTNIIKKCIQKMYKQINKDTYGSELEAYIISKNPQSVGDIDHWTRKFDQKLNERRMWI